MAETPAWIVEKLHTRHDRAGFTSGVGSLDEYLHRYAGQNEKSGISQHFVAVQAAGSRQMLGYYALSASAVAFTDAPDELTRRLPRYPIPVAHLGRLAVARAVQGRGLGEYLLLDALTRIVRIADEIGIVAVEVIALDDRARRFYLKYGFASLIDDPQHLYLPMTIVRRLGLS